jgi:ankyrin repeat protein
VFEFVARTIRIAPDALRSARALVAAATESSPDSRESAISALAATRAADAVAPAPPCLCAAASMGDGAIRTVEAMLDAGADADGCNGKRCLRPLAESAYADSAKVTRALIRRGAGVNKRNRGDRSTPLHWCKSAKIASILMQNGAKMHLRDRYNDTPRMRHQRHNTAWVIETAESASSGAAAASGSDCD